MLNVLNFDAQLRNIADQVFALRWMQLLREPARKEVCSGWQNQMNELHQGLPAPLTQLTLLREKIRAYSFPADRRASYLLGDRRGNWQTADRSSAGLLPRALEHPDALIRVYAARTVRWRGIFAVHTWIVVKEGGQSPYSRYDYTAWGEPIRVDGFAPDGRWFGAVPKTVVTSMGKRQKVSSQKFGR